jgi:hypothetical protein
MPLDDTIDHSTNYQFYYHHGVSRDSAVGITTGCVLDDGGVGVQVSVGSRIFFTSSRSDLGSTQPPIQWVPGALSPGVKQPDREADHSRPPSPEV